MYNIMHLAQYIILWYLLYYCLISLFSMHMLYKILCFYILLSQLDYKLGDLKGGRGEQKGLHSVSCSDQNLPLDRFLG